MGSFEKAIAFLKTWEGGYVNNPRDPGGETKFGISKRAHPQEDIPNLTRERAKVIYREQYWNKIGGDELPENIALAVFDFAVNSGPRVAIKALQTGLNSRRSRQLKVDGRIGPETVAASGLNPAGLVEAITDTRAQLYQKIIQKDPSQVEFQQGWENRLKAQRAGEAERVELSTRAQSRRRIQSES